MPWTEDHYPPAMRRLPLEVRLKAVEIANAMLEEGYDEGQVIRMAIAAAKRWAWSADRHPAECDHSGFPPQRTALVADVPRRPR